MFLPMLEVSKWGTSGNEGEVRTHLYENGIDRIYVTWVFHGEKEGDSAVMRPGSNLVPIEMNDERVREGVIEDMGSFVDAAYGVFDRGDGVSGNEEFEPDQFVPETYLVSNITGINSWQKTSCILVVILAS